uniref:GPR110 protein n=1 Tax=Homo sapiens TaxID=9606 RepID=Q3SXM8_HUMAN|nr:GPR110 protein [Homo sapiens]
MKVGVLWLISFFTFTDGHGGFLGAQSKNISCCFR